MNLIKSGAYRTLHRLEGRKLIKLEESARGVRATLTEKGKKTNRSNIGIK